MTLAPRVALAVAVKLSLSRPERDSDLMKRFRPSMPLRRSIN
jgi:hypothetical protein